MLNISETISDLGVRVQYRDPIESAYGASTGDVIDDVT